MQPLFSRTSLLAGGLALVGAACVAPAATLYDSGGFEASAGFSTGTGGLGQALAGQTAGSVNSSLWVQAPTPNPGVTPSAYVYPYLTPTAPNYQFVQVQDPNVPVGNANYFNPTVNDTTPYTPAAHEGVAITWTMSVLSAANNPFFGITAYGSGGKLIAEAGVDGTTGLLVANGNTTVPAGFQATTAVYYNYELLLDYTAQTYSIYTAPSGAGTFTLRASGAFVNAVTTFEDADISSFGLPQAGGATLNYGGAANFDYYSVQTAVVPEPASLGLAAAAFGLLGVRRRRSSQT